jgi:glycosyltransferase involved in cell wall biosynthesis
LVKRSSPDYFFKNFSYSAGLSDRVVFNSKQIIPLALAEKGISPNHVVYIPNGIDIESRIGTGAGANILRRLGIPPDATLIGCGARLYPQKGHAVLISAFAEVVEAEPETVFVLLGDGPLWTRLEAQAAKRCPMLPHGKTYKTAA